MGIGTLRRHHKKAGKSKQVEKPKPKAKKAPAKKAA